MRHLLIPLIPLALAACSQVSPSEPVQPEAMGTSGVPLEQEIAEGRGVASAVCANCHGLDQEDAVRPDAPALRHVLNNYDPDTLHDNFEQGLKVGHPDMPQFHFGPLGADVLLVYLKSIQEPEPNEG